MRSCLLFFLLIISITGFSQPVISSFTPEKGSPESLITITGSGFDTNPAGNVVYFGSTRAAVNSATSSSLTVSVPYGATYSPITVTTNTGIAYSRKSFLPTFSGGISSFTVDHFQKVIDTTSSNYMYSVALTDLDVDGKTDIIASSGAVYRNIGTVGNIALALTLNLNPVNGISIASGDLDGDGKSDIAIANGSANTVSIYRNTSTVGNISFATKVDISTGAYVNKLSIADIDGDGKPEIIAALTNSYKISIFLNSGSIGNISFATNYDIIRSVRGAPYRPSCLSISDFNNDGKPDVAVGYSDSYIENDTTLIIYNNQSTNSNISFSSNPVFSGHIGYPVAMSIGDLNQDGKSDIVILNNFGLSTIYKNFSSTSSVTVIPVTSLTVGNSSNDISISDLDGDGYPDIAFANSSPSSIYIFKNTGDPNIRFLSKTDFATNISGLTAISSADMDNDGKSDLISVSAGWVSRLGIFRNNCASPIINSFTPLIGGRDTIIHIRGKDLSAVTKVMIGGIDAASFIIDSSTSIRAVVSTGATGMVSAEALSGTGSLRGFTFIPQPSISSFSPDSAGANSAITIHGSNFTNVNSVLIGGTAAVSFSVLSSTLITATVPNGVISDSIKITTVGGMSIISGFTFIPAPSITSFTPTSATNGDTISITGTNLTATTGVSLGGTAVASFSVLSSTNITAVVGSGSTGTLSVTTSGGNASLAGFTYIAGAPTISSFTPTTATTGATITVTGTNLTGTTSVTLGGTAVASFNVMSSTTLTASVGSGSTGSLSITTAGGTVALPGFTYLTLPTISSFAATSGPIGSLVTITGDNLNNLSSITIGGVTALVVSNTTTKIVAMVMPGATTGGVSITTGNGTANATGNFTVTATNFPSSKQGSYLSGTGKTGFSPAEGGSVAISADGNTAIVGAPGDGGSGSIYVYVRNGDIWSQQGSKLTITDFAGGYSTFGSSVAINADGNTIVAGMGLDNNGLGAVWVFRRNGNIWAQQGSKLVGSGSIGTIISQGSSVSISADGNTIVEGGPGDNSGSGAVWVFRFNGTSWVQQGNKLVGTGVVQSAGQGTSVAISADGSTIVEGGTEDNAYVGASWIFSFDGTNWNQQGNKLVGSGYSFQPKQGSAVSISADGNTVIIGGKYDNVYTGAAWIFTRTGSSWSQQGNKLVGSAYIGQPQQGFSVSISGDGNTALVGGFKDNNPVGGVWVFLRNGNIWEQKNKLVDSTNYTGGNAYVDNFGQGYSVSISTDGTTAIVGAPLALFTGFGSYGFSFVYKMTLPPSITSFEPLSAATGATITVTGTNLTGTTSVSLGGTAVASFNVLSSTTLTAVVGTGSSGTLSVTTSAGTGGLAGFTYVSSPPNITSFTPTSATSGATITVTGTNLNGTTAVSLGGTGVASFSVLSSTTLIATVANGSSGNLSITTSAGTASLGGFTYFNPSSPTISSFSPTSAAAGETITITGTNLSGTTGVTIGGTAVQSFTIISSTTIRVNVGSGSTGSVNISSSGGSATLAGFTFIGPPVISSLLPTSGGTGTLITLAGTDFRNITSVLFGGRTTSFQVLSPTTITLTAIEPGSVSSASNVNIRVNTIGNSASINGFSFVYPAPTLTSMSPTSAASGSSITLTGTNFTGVTSVTFGGTAAASFEIKSPTTIFAVAGTGSSGSISVSTNGGSASLAGFTYIPTAPPTITAFTPLSATTGATVTINGTNLNGTTSVSLGGTAAASFQVLSSTTLTAVVASGATGSISVTTSNGTSALSGFTFVPPVINSLAITAFEPLSAAKGATLTVTGTNLTGISSVSLGGTAVASFRSLSSTTLTVVVGSGSSGSLSVTTSTGTASLPGFTYLNNSLAPTITSFTPLSAAKGSVITINGTNFTGATSVMLGTSALDSVEIASPTTIRGKVGQGSSGSVSVTTPNGTASLNGFTYLNNSFIPTITSFEPLSAVKGATLTITGTNLTGISSVSLGGTAVASFRSFSSTTVTVVVGSGSSGSLSVTTSFGTAALSGFNFIPETPTITATGALVICQGENVLLRSSDSIYNAQWYKDGDAIAGSQKRTFTVTESGVYTLKNVSQGIYSAASKPITITVNPLPNVSQPHINNYQSDTLVCFTDSLLLSSQQNYERYLWSTGDTTASIKITSNKSVSLQAGTNQSSCLSLPSKSVHALKNLTNIPVISKQNDSLIISSAAKAYQWLLNNKPLPGDTSNQLNLNAKGIYNVRTSADRYCWNTSADYVVFLAPVTVKKSFDLTVYPNPTNGIFSLLIRFEKNTTALVKVSIANASGILMVNTKKLLFSDKTIKIPINSILVKGTYTVKIDVNGEINSQQIIVM